MSLYKILFKFVFTIQTAAAHSCSHHDLINMSSRPHYVIITSSSQSHQDLIMTSSRIITISSRHLPDLITTSSRPQHNLTTTSSHPHQDIIRFSSPPRHLLCLLVSVATHFDTFCSQCHYNKMFSVPCWKLQ